MTEHLDQNRRQFLRVAVASASVVLTACGGADGQAAVADTLSPAAADSGALNEFSVSPAPPEPQPAPPPAPTAAPAPERPAFRWWIAPDETLFSPAGSSLTIASGAVGMTASVSPPLPAGRTLTVTPGGNVDIIAADDASPLDLHGPWSIVVST